MAGCLLCQGKAPAGGCDFQQLLTKLFLTKGCFELRADTEQGESSTHSAGFGRGACNGQPRVQFPEKQFLQRVHKSQLETLLLREVLVCSAVVVVCYSAPPAHTWATTLGHQRRRPSSQWRMHLCRPLTEARARGWWAPCLQEVCAGEHPHHQVEDLCWKRGRKILCLLGSEMETPRMLKPETYNDRRKAPSLMDNYRTGSVCW